MLDLASEDDHIKGRVRTPYIDATSVFYENPYIMQHR